MGMIGSQTRMYVPIRPWKRSSTEKIVSEDPEKSPDWAYALVYFTWKDTDALAYGFLGSSDKQKHL